MRSNRKHTRRSSHGKTSNPMCAPMPNDFRKITQSSFWTQIKTSRYIQVSGHEFSILQIWNMWHIIQALLHKACINVTQMQFQYRMINNNIETRLTNDTYMECEKYRLHSLIFSVSSSNCLLCLFESLIFSNFWNPFL